MVSSFGIFRARPVSDNVLIRLLSFVANTVTFYCGNPIKLQPHDASLICGAGDINTFHCS